MLENTKGALMVKCLNCGHKKLLLKTMRCLHCGKQCCEKCALYVLSVGFEYKWACSEQCARKFEQKVLDYSLKDIETEMDDEFDSLENELWYEACIAALDKDDSSRVAWFNLLKQGKDYAIRIMDIDSKSSDGKHKTDLRDKFHNRALLALATNIEAVGRPLDAAIIYEKHLKMYDKARELREKQKQVTVKRVDISVNLNELLQQVKDGGIVVVYRCPRCGGKLKIGKDTSMESLKVCEYCGSEIEVMEIADFLKTAVS
jgi:DNA-directed RNA polymerase subunit RPC12/RpoP